MTQFSCVQNKAFMTEKEARFRDLIASRVIVDASEARSVTPGGVDSPWIFDFRRIFFTPEGLDLAADIFWDRFEDQYPFQVAGLEAAALPIVAAIVMRGLERGKRVNGFFIRKSRNKSGLLNMIEGMPTKEKTILVDDLMNRGGTFLRQIEVLKRAGIPLYAIFAYVRYRDASYYKFVNDAGARLETVFSLSDFGKELLVDPFPTLPNDIFEQVWSVGMHGANYFHVVPKSAPAIDESHVYFGSDSGHLWSLKQDDGAVVWSFKIEGFGNQGKTIFSSPALYKGLLYFGAYDGNIYALDAKTGNKKWMYAEADWVGSSPAIGTDTGLVYIGLEFGLFRKRGGIVALDAKTGKKKWQTSLPGLTHGSPGYNAKYNMVVIGSNDFGVHAFNAKTGESLWNMRTAGEVRGGCVFDEVHGYVAFGSYDGRMYVLDVRSGETKFSYQTGAAIYSTPFIQGDFLYTASQDKRVYCVNLKKRVIAWVFETSARIFASPVVVGDNVYIGSNDGRFYEINAKTGKLQGFFQTAERITNRAAYNKKTQRFFVPTFANEMFALKRNPPDSREK